MRSVCFLQHFANFYVLLVGNVFRGTATALLMSSFESWVICEHHKVCGNQLWT